MMERDSQRQRVYDWERSVWKRRQWRSVMTLEECQAYSDRVWRSERGRYGLARVLPPHITWARSGGRAIDGARGGPGLIKLSRRARNEIVLLHEMAHLLTPGARHGPRFVGCMIGLYARHCAEDAQTLLDSAVAFGVKVDARSIGAVPEATLHSKVALHLPGTDIELAVALGVSYRQIRGAALHLIRAGRARWWRGRLVEIDPQP